MKPARIAAVMLRQVYLFRGSPARFFPMFIWATIDIILWGFITRYLGNNVLAHNPFVASLLGAVLLWDFLIRVMHGIILTFLEDVWSKNFLNIFATPLTILEYATGLALSGILTSLISLLVMMIVAVAGFQLALGAFGLLAIPFAAILLIFGVALGIFGAALVLRFGPAIEMMVWPIPAMLSPFACVFYPLDSLPPWMQAIAHIMPPMYVFEGMRSILATGRIAGGALLTGGLLAAGALGLALWFFAFIYGYAMRTGLIARYSAESIT